MPPQNTTEEVFQNTLQESPAIQYRPRRQA
jgi:hypothetical protein